jgi:hypothetical protein
MKTTIYMQLMDEGTTVYRPVEAEKITSDSYLILESNEYDNEDETWEFPPGSIVLVKFMLLENENLPIASELISTMG